MTSAAAPRPAVRVLYGLLALALLCGWLLAAALPVGAAQEWGVESPGAGEVVADAIMVRAYVVTFQEQRIDAVRSRLRRGDQPVGEVRNLSPRGSSQDAVLPGQTRSTYEGASNLRALPNGRYVIEVSVVNAIYPEGSPWRGHEIVLDAPPIAKIETVRVADPAARTVEVRWVRSTAPDHVRYVVQRAGPGGDFADVHTATTSDAVTHVDTVPEHGEYRYRVRVVRMAADGSEREAVSEPRSVSVEPDASGRPETGEEPEGSEDPSPAPTDGEATPGGSGPGTSAPRLTDSPPSGGTNPSTTSGRSQRPNVAPPPNPNTTFEERLDYGVELPEWEAEEGVETPEVADSSSEGGTLTVFGGEETSTDQAVVPVAAGLVLTLFGLHIVRFLRTDAPK